MAHGILLLLIAFLISFDFRSEKQNKILFLSELKSLYLIVSISGLAMLLIVNGVSDAFYQLIPAFWIVVILMIASLSYLEGVDKQTFTTQNSKRFLMAFLLVIAFDTFIYIMDRTKEKLLFHRDQEYRATMRIEISKEFDYNWSEELEVKKSQLNWV